MIILSTFRHDPAQNNSIELYEYDLAALIIVFGKSDIVWGQRKMIRKR